MKKIYCLLVFISLFSFVAKAQSIVNPNFENWSPSGNPAPFDWEEPTNWKSTNSQTEWTSAGVRKTTDAYAGSFACRLTSVNISGGWPSIICNGNPSFTGSPFSDPDIDLMTGGTPINSKPNKVAGYYKFDNNNGLDSGYAKVILKKFNPALNIRDTIGIGDFYFKQALTYTQFEITINDLAPSVTPDSIIIAFYSTNPDNPRPPNPPASIGLVVDSLHLVYTTASIKLEQTSNFNPTIYPNPAKSTFMILSKNPTNYSVELYSTNGQKLKSQVGNGVMKLDVSDIAPGIYHLRIEEQGGDHSLVKSVIIE